MKILVPMKRVIDYNAVIEVKSDGTGVKTEGVKMSMNPFDEIALEEAVRFKEKHNAAVTIITIGSTQCQDILRQGLAMGADHAVHVVSDAPLESIDIAKILKKHIDDNSYDLILMGKQAIDGDHHQTAEMLAAMLKWPLAPQTCEITINQDKLTAATESDRGLRRLTFKTPAVISTDLRLNEPRFITIPNLMKARQKAIESKTPADYNVQPIQRLKTTHVAPPKKRTGGPVYDKPDAFIEACEKLGVLA